MLRIDDTVRRNINRRKKGKESQSSVLEEGDGDPVAGAGFKAF